MRRRVRGRVSLNSKWNVEIHANEEELNRNAKKQAKVDGASDAEKPKKKSRKRGSPGVKGSDLSTSDPYHSGHFAWATDEDQQRALALGRKAPDEIIDSAKNAEVPLDACATLKMCWNPGKKGITQDLEQARFSVKDHLLTRQKLAKTDVLTHRAAACIVDFCPDLLWRGMLLRIASESGLGNKDIRDRMCLNGNYADKATITKRIGAALGQKQQQSTEKRRKKKEAVRTAEEEDVPAEKTRGYAKGETQFYNTNVEDYKNYVDYFGKRTSHRNQLKIKPVGRKRKAIEVFGEEDSDAEGRSRTGWKRTKESNESTQSPDAMVIDSDDDDETAETTGAEGGSGSAEEASDSDMDAVSEQSDTLLDEMDDD